MNEAEVRGLMTKAGAAMKFLSLRQAAALSLFVRSSRQIGFFMNSSHADKFPWRETTDTTSTATAGQAGPRVGPSKGGAATAGPRCESQHFVQARRAQHLIILVSGVGHFLGVGHDNR